MKQLLLGRNGKPVLEEYQEMPLQAGYCLLYTSDAADE